VPKKLQTCNKMEYIDDFQIRIGKGASVGEEASQTSRDRTIQDGLGCMRCGPDGDKPFIHLFMKSIQLSYSSN
jgi:hypothetical protein